jgi:plastocyanin
MRRRALLATAGAALAGLSGCLDTLGTAGARCDEDCDVGMSTVAFLPETHETTVGSTVTWVNTSSRGHSVTAYENALPEGAEFFASGEYDSEAAAREDWDAGGAAWRIDPRGTYEYTFELPGTYPYFCIPHESMGMVGTVEVTE